jgi:hypothetical protein
MSDLKHLKQGDVVVHGCLFRNRPLSAAERQTIMANNEQATSVTVGRPVVGKPDPDPSPQ